jgi:rhodanese-related sulfurtransferase
MGGKEMGKMQFGMVFSFAIFLVLAGCSQVVVSDMKVPRMTKEELKSLLGNQGVIVLDVRITDDWKNSDSKIKGAIREDPEKDYRAWASKYPKDKTLVFYCAWADEATSAWMAQQFISMGYKKVFALKGGWNEWFKANFPVEPK